MLRFRHWLIRRLGGEPPKPVGSPYYCLTQGQTYTTSSSNSGVITCACPECLRSLRERGI